MLDRISKRITTRNAPIRRFVTRHPQQMIGYAAGAIGILGATAAWIARRRRNGDSIALLSTDGPDERSRAELYETARKRKIPGRSNMTKEELREAIESV